MKKKTRTLSAPEEADILKSLKGAVMAMEVLAHLEVPSEKAGYIRLLEEIVGRKFLLPEKGFRTSYIEGVTNSIWTRYKSMLKENGVGFPESSEQIIYELSRFCVMEMQENMLPVLSLESVLPELEELIKGLPELQEKVIRKHFLESPDGKLMSHKQIAEELCIPYRKVSGLIVKALYLMRQTKWDCRRMLFLNYF